MGPVWRQEADRMKKRKTSVRCSLYATYVVGPARLYCGWPDVIVHTRSQFLLSYCTAQLQFQWIYTCYDSLSVCSLISHHIYCSGTWRAPSGPFFPFNPSGLWEKIAVQTTDVYSGPRLPHFQRVACFQPLDIT